MIRQIDDSGWGLVEVDEGVKSGNSEKVRLREISSKKSFIFSFDYF